MMTRIAEALDSPRFIAYFIGYMSGCLTTVGLAYFWTALS